MKYTIGIDISTTATKSLLMNSLGEMIDVVIEEYPYESPQPLWSEQDPSLWWNATISTIKTLLSKTGVDPAGIQSIGLTGQMHGLVVLDNEGSVIRPSILWNDQRTEKECDEIRSVIGKKKLIEITGNDALTGFTLPKILWLKRNEPDHYHRIAHILLPKDYIRYCLTGNFASDVADSAGTLLLDLRSRSWSKDITESLGIATEWLPSLHEGTDVTGVITKEAALITGLIAGTPVVGGGGDQAAQAVGVGAISEGIAALTLGTSGVVFATTSQPYYEPNGKVHAFCHSVPFTWHVMGVMLSAAGSLRWYRDTFFPKTSYDELLAPARKVLAGSEDLIFLPYLSGERTPYPDPNAKGVFFGLTLRHTQAHITRSVLEGVSFGLKDNFDLLLKVGLTPFKQVRVSGGGANSPLWRQILADILETELITVNTTEGAAYGAAILAAVGVGLWDNVNDACNKIIKTTTVTKVNTDNVKTYRRLHQLYSTLYPKLKTSFIEISE